MWSKQEWLPLVLTGSIYIGLLPDGVGDLVNWVSVEHCAQFVLELAEIHSML